jgi:hypothetical protein
MHKAQEEWCFAGEARADDNPIHRSALPKCCLGKTAARSLQLARFPVSRRSSVLARSPDQRNFSPACLPTPWLMSCFSSESGFRQLDADLILPTDSENRPRIPVSQSVGLL